MGLGSAKEGVAHWWAQRLSALLLVPLSLWFCASLIAEAGASRASLVLWLRSPVSAILLILTLAAVFYHGALGLQVVIEDYAPSERLKIAGIVGVRLAAIVVGTAGIFAVLKLAIGG
jgi:succinate dehydrogenase membrane anchor subunit